MRKLIVLTGEKKLRAQVFEKMQEIKAVSPLSVGGDVFEVIAELLKQDKKVFMDPKGMKKPLKGAPIEVTPKHLARYAARLSMGMLPSGLAGKLLKTPEDALEYFIKTIGETRWGNTWIVDRFLDFWSYAFPRVYAVADADGFEAYIKSKAWKGEVVVVEVTTAKKKDTTEEKDEEKFENADLGPVDLKVEHEKGTGIEATTLKILTELKTKFFKKG
jgi:hypothetical protein